MATRQDFTREAPDVRRKSLIAACATCLAHDGAQGVSVRSVCAEAGVSPGLLRHYFDGIDALVAATYRHIGGAVTDALTAAVDAAGDDPRARLVAYVTASFRPPVTDDALFGSWIAFWSLARGTPGIAAIHDTLYAESRQAMERLIAACPGAPADPRLAAVALTALVDGLWLELSLGNPPFSVDEAHALARAAIDAQLTGA